MARASFVLALSFLMGCKTIPNQTPSCRTDYVPLFGSSRCIELQAAIETVANDLFPPLTEKLKAQRWSVKVDPRINASGYTYCDSRYVVLDTDDWAKSALAHELYHVLECPFENVGHTRWKDPDATGKTLDQRDGLLNK